MEQRRLLLAFGLSLLLLTLYQELVLKRYRRPATTPSSSEEPAGPATAPPQIAHEPATQRAGALAAPAGGGAEVVIETDLVRATISTVGARLADLRLKNYRRSVSSDSEPLDLVTSAPILPLTLDLGNESSDADVVYQPDKTSVRVSGSERATVVFVGESSKGVRIQKRYTFTGDAYLFDLSADVSGAAAPTQLGVVVTPVPLDSAAGRESALALAQRKVQETAVTKLKPEPLTYDDTTWAGFAAQYFLSAVIPASAAGRAAIGTTETVPIATVHAPLSEGRADFHVYVGPKERDVLSAAGHDLDRALDFGMFWFIALPLLRALHVLKTLTGNYGIAIIILTTMVKVVTIPLTQTTFRNMREMRKIQPQMAKLRERFKDDQAALQKEMMELYRRHRVNPLSGCLPMILQLPIFVGLYNALSHAIELRHAPFALWIDDLSAPDRLMVAGVGIPVLTLLMGASMFVQQWLSPQQGDPTQQRMMLFMPLVFTFMFINFPAGLVLYWLVNNVLSIGQQYAMLRSEA